MNNDNTIQFGNLFNNGKQAKDNGKLWKKVSLGTTTGILLGAIGTRAVDQLDASLYQEESGDNSETDTSGEADIPIYSDAPMAHVSNRMSFDEAFAAARSEVGPGGVFVWRGGIYGTYYETEWDAMNDAQKTEYALSVHPAVTPEYVQININYEVHPQMVVEAKEVEPQDIHKNTASKIQSSENETYPSDDDDVHIIGQGTVQGHSAVALDMTGNDEADVVIIDVDDSHSVTDPDVVVFREGMAATIGDIIEGNPPVSLVGEEYQAGIETPDVAPDTPDYMDDGSVYM